MDLDGPHTLAGAICFLAASQHSKDVYEQRQFAAVFHSDCVDGFGDVKVSEAVEAYVLDMITKAGKK